MEKAYPYFIYAFLAILAVIAFSLLFPAYNNLKKMEIKLSDMEAKLDARKAECFELKKRLNELENNPKAIEKIAREKFNMCKKGEIVYTYEDSDLKPPEPPKKPDEKAAQPQQDNQKQPPEQPKPTEQKPKSKPQEKSKTPAKKPTQ